MVDAGDESVGDRRRGAEDDDERDRPFAELEQQDGEREPGDRRHGLQPGDQRADGDRMIRDDETSAADDDADHERHRESVDGAFRGGLRAPCRRCRRR